MPTQTQLLLTDIALSVLLILEQFGAQMPFERRTDGLMHRQRSSVRTHVKGGSQRQFPVLDVYFTALVTFEQFKRHVGYFES
jgi:hypothetical protein